MLPLRLGDNDGMSFQKAPIGRPGRGPHRHGVVTSDLDNWSYAVCGRVLPEYRDQLGPERRKPPSGPRQPKNPGSPPGSTGPDKNPPVPPSPPASS